MNRTQSDHFDPIPILLGFGNHKDVGLWLGDRIYVADELPPGYKILEEVMLNWCE